jgi:hypothetical protein
LRENVTPKFKEMRGEKGETGEREKIKGKR